jgi:hypothetical protein
MDLIAQVKHAVLDSNRLCYEEEMESGVLPQSGQGLWGNPGSVGFALLEDLGHEEGGLEVVAFLARPGSPSSLGLTAADGGRRQAELVEEEAVGSPIGSAAFKDVDGCGLERFSQALAFFDEPQSLGEVLVLYLTVAQDLLTVG